MFMPGGTVAEVRRGVDGNVLGLSTFHPLSTIDPGTTRALTSPSVPHLYEILFNTFAFVLGASIGSFLNVCIYRLPLEMKVNEPKRSFCPSCKYQIPWYHNLPLFSWLALRGKCANCGARISFRYFGVELLTGLLFLAVWLKLMRWPQPGWPDTPWLLALPYFVLVSLLIVATFIDFEHFIIPDEITWGGAAAGLLLSFAIPTLHGQESAIFGGVWSLVGAAVGYFALWGVVELGKIAFGKKRVAFEKPEPFTWVRRDQEADFTVGEEKMLWSDFFVRGNEKLLMTCTGLEIDGQPYKDAALNFTCDWLEFDGRRIELVKTETIRGVVTEATFPREAMGFGDVKFIACIGAFLGWKAVVFTIMAGSTLGAVFGGLSLLAGHREWSAKIPFGPYLALGALLWLFTGPEIVGWYLRYATGGG
jgi:leader peptidase (prepilin peptidase)/N-methyltransferase